MGWVSWMRVTASAVNPGADEAEEVSVVHQTDSTDSIEGSKATVAFGANKDEEDKEEEIALHVAYGYGEVKCAKILLGLGAKADVLDKKKNIVLHYAADYSRSLSINDRLPMAITYTHLSGAQHQPPHGGMSSVLNEEYTMFALLVSAFIDVVSQELMGQVGLVQIFYTCD